jgi:hypothetical protein
MPDLSLLRFAGVLEVILYLSNYPKGLRKIDIRKGLGLNPKTASNVYKLLEKAHLLQIIRYNDATAFALNEYGEEIAHEVAKLNAIMDKIEDKIQKTPNILEVHWEDENFPKSEDSPKEDDDNIEESRDDNENALVPDIDIKKDTETHTTEYRIIPVKISPKKKTGTLYKIRFSDKKSKKTKK